MQIQDFLIAAIQNITILIRQSKHRMSKSNVRTVEVRKYHEKHAQYGVLKAVLGRIFVLGRVSLNRAYTFF